MMSKNSKGPGIRRTQPFHKYQTHYHATSRQTLTPLSNQKRRQFDPNLLPSPREYYTEVLKKFYPQEKQATALCPFHPDKIPSFSVNLIHGMFFCFSCGARGGNVLTFHMRLHGIKFTKAVTELGAWKYE
ncbi:CHC2 zinc finger domain-containing protein [Rickettsiella massiliensis]|uniref:CHC2 zinc finger domain-containing protein n=1 Tax=Rickettsiella massiliensis TaxID=676517 RepID=UPI00030A65BF|nr:CHC2 zinc finger domain-containing protein [Rickettsiella massiliensis]